MAALLEPGEIAVDALHVGGDRGAAVARHGADLQILLDGLAHERAAAFRRVGDAEAHDVLDRAPGDALSREADVAGGAQHARYGAQRGGLAGAVGAQQRRDAALRHVEIEPEQHLGAAVECAQPPDLEQGAHDVVPR